MSGDFRFMSGHFRLTAFLWLYLKLIIRISISQYLKKRHFRSDFRCEIITKSSAGKFQGGYGGVVRVYLHVKCPKKPKNTPLPFKRQSRIVRVNTVTGERVFSTYKINIELLLLNCQTPEIISSSTWTPSNVSLSTYSLNQHNRRDLDTLYEA